MTDNTEIVKEFLKTLPESDDVKTLSAALYMIKEAEKNQIQITKEYFDYVMDLSKTVTFVEEEISIEKMLQEDGVVAGPANVTGANVSTDKPVIKKKDIKQYFKFNKKNSPIPPDSSNAYFKIGVTS